jgi:hypothetical protein
MAHHRLHQRKKLVHEFLVLAYDRSLAKERPHPGTALVSNVRPPLALLAFFRRAAAISTLPNNDDEPGCDLAF